MINSDVWWQNSTIHVFLDLCICHDHKFGKFLTSSIHHWMLLNQLEDDENADEISWRKWRVKDEGWRLRGFAYGQMNKQTDICNCRVAFGTENTKCTSKTISCSMNMSISLWILITFLVEFHVRMIKSQLVQKNYKTENVAWKKWSMKIDWRSIYCCFNLDTRI